MKAMKCELCSGTDFIRDQEFFKCEFCRTKYTLDQAKKLIGSVSIDRSDEYAKLIRGADSFLKSDDTENSEKFILQALSYDPDKIDGWLMKARLETHKSTSDTLRVMDYQPTMERLLSALSSALRLAKDEAERLECAKVAYEIYEDLPKSDFPHSWSTIILNFSIEANPQNIDALKHRMDLAAQRYRNEGLLATEPARLIREETKATIDSTYKKLTSLGARPDYPHLPTSLKKVSVFSKHPICAPIVVGTGAIFFIFILPQFFA